MDINNHKFQLLYKRVMEILSFFRTDEIPNIIEITKDSKVDIKVNGKEVAHDIEAVKVIVEKLEKRENIKGVISDNQLELLGSVDNKIYNLRNIGSNQSYIALNKKGEIYNHLFAKTVFELIDSKGIYNINEEQILGTAGIKTLEKIYNTFINIDYNKIELFQLLHDISLITYENTESKGNILFCHGDKSRFLESEVELIDTVPLEKSSFKKIRKLLEICNGGEDICLLSNGASIYGFGKLKSKFYIGENSFKISFKRKGFWKIETVKNNTHFKKVFDVEYGEVYLNKNPFLIEDFLEKFRNVFGKDEGFHKYNPEIIWKYIQYAIKQKHGTMLIVSSKAESEVVRLSKQSFRINKFKNLSEELIIGMTSIDGSLFIDPKGYCYAIGTIIDGQVNKSLGDISRGARYNSALKYLYSNKGTSCIIIIVSEDGYVDVKTHNDLLIETSESKKQEEIYYQNLLKWLKSDDLDVAKKAYEEYIEFDKYMYKLVEAEFMGKAAQHHAQLHRDTLAVSDFDKIRNLTDIFLREKTQKFMAYYENVMQTDYGY